MKASHCQFGVMWVVGSMLCGYGGLALADEPSESTAPAWYVAVMGSHIQPAADRDARNGLGASFLFGLPIGAGFATEVDLFGHRIRRARPNLDDSDYGMGLDLTYTPKDQIGLPFLIAGGGAVHEKFGTLHPLDDNGNITTVERNSSVHGFVRSGLGFYIPNFYKDFKVAQSQNRNSYLARVDLSWYGVVDGNANSTSRLSNDVRLNIGFQFGRVRNQSQPVVTPPPVSEAVQPPVEPPQQVVAVADEDGDGDGVPDGQDKCPHTPTGQKVDAQGCVVLEVTVLRDVAFDYDSDRLRPEAREILESVAATMRLHPEFKVTVRGHTDSRGTDEYNDRLSLRRAQSATSYLIQIGIEPRYLTSVGLGKRMPIADNSTEEGQEKNRRVDFVVEKYVRPTESWRH